MRSIGRAVDGAILDIRYGARLLWRSPWFTAVGIASLAIGLGSGVALFTFMNAVLFRPLPGRDTADIHTIYTSDGGGGRYGASSFADFQSFTSGAPELFRASCATTNIKGNMLLPGGTQALPGAVLSGGCFEALELRRHLGRLLNQSDDTPTGSSPAVVISHALWRRAFDADPNAVGRLTLINGASAVIVGVSEPGFAGLSLDSGADFWVSPQLGPIVLPPRTLTNRRARRFRVYVRLSEGVTAAQAGARLSVIGAQLRVEDPRAWTEESGSTRTVTVAREVQSRFATSQGAAEGIATTTIGAIAGLLVVACVNLATMIMARGAARTHELSVRSALGASRGRLLRQLTTESLLISAGGIVAGVCLVAGGLAIFDAYRPAEIPAFNLAVDWRVATFSIVMALVAPVLFGLAPGAHALRLAIAEGLKGRPVLVRHRRLRVGARELLIVAQVVASFAMLIMAALFMQSLMSVSPIQQALAAKGVAVVSVDLNTAATSETETIAISNRLLRAAEGVSDAEGVTAAALVPMTGSYLGISGQIGEGTDAAAVVLDGNIVAPGYFELMGITRRAGRTFDARDHERAPRVAVVSASLARRLWGSTTAVGRTMHLDIAATEVIGVVTDVPYRSPSDPAHPVVYLPLGQVPRDRFVVHARVRNDGKTIAALDRALRAVDGRILLGTAMPLDQMFEQVRIGGKIAQGTGAAAGLLQLGLALMATWGLVAYAVERRTKEIAVRRALGATEASIVQLLIRPTLWLVGVGAALGCASGVVTAKVLHSIFIGLAPIDLTVVMPAAALVTLAVVGAAWLPARRATSIEPASALKEF